MHEQKEKQQVGLWVDHRQATIVHLHGKEHEITHVLSEAEKQLRRTPNGVVHRSSETSSDPRDDRKDRSFESDLLHYYEHLAVVLKNVDEILLMGPGEAKGELQKRLEKDGFGKKIIAVQATDKLTEPQIVQQVKQYFKSEHH